jgi:hypothetical protein
VCTDPDDDRFLECAKEAGADYLVTGRPMRVPSIRFGLPLISRRRMNRQHRAVID